MIAANALCHKICVVIDMLGVMGHSSCSAAPSDDSRVLCDYVGLMAGH